MGPGEASHTRPRCYMHAASWQMGCQGCHPRTPNAACMPHKGHTPGTVCTCCRSKADEARALGLPGALPPPVEFQPESITATMREYQVCHCLCGVMVAGKERERERERGVWWCVLFLCVCGGGCQAGGREEEGISSRWSRCSQPNLA